MPSELKTTPPDARPWKKVGSVRAIAKMWPTKKRLTMEAVMEKETRSFKAEKPTAVGAKAKADITQTELCNLFCVHIMNMFPHISDVRWEPFGDHAVEFVWLDSYNKNPPIRVAMILPMDNLENVINSTVEVMNGNYPERQKSSRTKT